MHDRAELTPITVLITTNGRRECYARMIESLNANVHNSIRSVIVHDDSGDPAYREWVEHDAPKPVSMLPNGDAVWACPFGPSAGLSHSIRALWAKVKQLTQYDNGLPSSDDVLIADYILHMEDDFIFNGTAPIEEMIDILRIDRSVAQVALLRQPWFANEIEAGGVIQARQVQGATFDQQSSFMVGHEYIVHQDHWTLNPSVYSVDLCREIWPKGQWSESRFGRQIFAKRKVSAYYGLIGDAPRVTHIGTERKGVEY